MIDRDEEPEAVDDGPREDIVKSVLNKMASMYVRTFGASALSITPTYKQSWLDSFMFC